MKHLVPKILLILISVCSLTEFSVKASSTALTTRNPQALVTGNKFLDSLALISDSDDEDTATFVQNHNRRMRQMDEDIKAVDARTSAVITQAQAKEKRLVTTLQKTQQQLTRGMLVTEQQLATIQQKFIQFLQAMQDRFNLLREQGLAFKTKYKANKALIERFEAAEQKYKANLERYEKVLQYAQVQQATSSFAELKALEQAIGQESNILQQYITNGN